MEKLRAAIVADTLVVLWPVHSRRIPAEGQLARAVHLLHSRDAFRARNSAFRVALRLKPGSRRFCAQGNSVDIGSLTA